MHRVLLLALMLGLVPRAQGQYWQERIVSAPVEVTSGGLFGASLDLDGDLLLVGAPGAAIGAPTTGAAYLFDRNEGGANVWDRIASFHLPAPVSLARFGAQVLLVGDLAFVSAPDDPFTGVRTGSVYVFRKDLGGPNEWGFAQRVRCDTVQAGLAFGSRIAYHAGTLLVACPGYDENTGDALPGVGALALFSEKGSGLFEQARFVPGHLLVDAVTARPCFGDRFQLFQGLFVHQEKEDDDAQDPGRAYYLHADSLLDPSLPLPPAHRLTLTETFGDPFADLILTEAAADGELLVVGGLHPYDAVDSVIEYHRAFTFSSNGTGGLMQRSSALPDTSASLQQWPTGREGWMVQAVAGHRLLIGASGDSSYTPLGHAEVFNTYDAATTNWTRIAYLQASDPHLGDRFGSTGALDDRVAIIGAPYYGPYDLGQVYVFLDPSVNVPEPLVSAADVITVSPDPIRRSADVLRATLRTADPAGTLLIRASNGTLLSALRAANTVDVPIHALSTGAYTLTWIPQNAKARPITVRFFVVP